MYLSHAVNAVTSVNAKCSHLDLVVFHYGHMGNLSLISVSFPKISAITVVYLDNDRENSRANALEQIAVPLFQSLRHYRVVGVSKGICHNMPSLLPCVAAVVKQRPHKLWYSKRGVGVVDVYSHLLVKVIKCSVNVHMLVYDIPDRRSAKEVLLTKS